MALDELALNGGFESAEWRRVDKALSDPMDADKSTNGIPVQHGPTFSAISPIDNKPKESHHAAVISDGDRDGLAGEAFEKFASRFRGY